MSSYIRNTKNPKTGKFETAWWIDDKLGSHHYGVVFEDGSVVDPDKTKLETNRLPTGKTWEDYPSTKKDPGGSKLARKGKVNPTIPQKELTEQIEEVLEEAKKTKSDNEIVQILWLIQGLDLWYRSKGKLGHSLEKVQRYVASRLLIRDSQLLDIVNQAVVSELELIHEIGFDNYSHIQDWLEDRIKELEGKK